MTEREYSNPIENRKSRFAVIGAIAGLALIAGSVGKLACSKIGLKSESKNKYYTDDFSKDSDGVLLARMIFGEARDCSYLERAAVGCTAVTRANDRKNWNGETIRQAILKPWQYSCFNENDPNKNVLMNPESYDAKSFYECLDVSKKILDGKVEDPSKITHYFNPKLGRPKWAREKNIRVLGKIEVGRTKRNKPIYSRHVFCREN